MNSVTCIRTTAIKNFENESKEVVQSFPTAREITVIILLWLCWLMHSISVAAAAVRRSCGLPMPDYHNLFQVTKYYLVGKAACTVTIW